MLNILNLIRLDQWAKNLLVFLVPISAARTEVQLYVDLFILFFGFSFFASTGYVINDILDLESDKAHYIKKYRMLPSGKISVKKASFIAFVIFAIGTLFLATLDFIILLICIFYLAMSMFYSRYLKYIKYIDILIISLFFVLRTYLGSLSTGISISLYLLSVIFFSSMALVTGKKLSILKDDKIKKSKIRTKIIKNYSNNELRNILSLNLILTFLTFNFWVLNSFDIFKFIFIFANIALGLFCLEFYKLSLLSKTEDFIFTLKNNIRLFSSFIIFVITTIYGIFF